PGAPMSVVVVARQLDSFDPAEELVVPLRDGRAQLEDLVELLELPEPERRAHVVEAVVIAESHVLEPPAGIATALVSQRAQEAPLVLRVRRHHAAFTRRDLLVRIEREDGARAMRADPCALVLRADRLARVLDQRESVP